MHPEEVKLLRPVGGENYTVTGQTTVQAGFGQTVADARIPVQPGELLAMHGLPFTYEGKAFPGYEFFCKTGPGGVLGVHPGDIPLGTTGSLAGEPEAGVPVVAVVEPDADHDGFGDETQDKCPRSAATQAECPGIVLDSYALPSRSKAVVLVSASSAAPVTVSGSAKPPKGRKAKLKGVTKSVVPGKLNRFTLNFPATLKSAIAALPAGKSITIKLEASATDVAGQKVTDKAQLKIKGQAG